MYYYYFHFYDIYNIFYILCLFVCLLLLVMLLQKHIIFWMCFESSFYANSSVPHNLAVGRKMKMKKKKASFEWFGLKHYIICCVCSIYCKNMEAMEAAFVAVWEHKWKNKFQKQFSKKFSLAFYKQFVCRRYYSNNT